MQNWVARLQGCRPGGMGMVHRLDLHPGNWTPLCPGICEPRDRQSQEIRGIEFEVDSFRPANAYGKLLMPMRLRIGGRAPSPQNHPRKNFLRMFIGMCIWMSMCMELPRSIAWIGSSGFRASIKFMLTAGELRLPGRIRPDARESKRKTPRFRFYPGWHLPAPSAINAPRTVALVSPIHQGNIILFLTHLSQLSNFNSSSQYVHPPDAMGPSG